MNLWIIVFNPLDTIHMTKREKNVKNERRKTRRWSNADELPLVMLKYLSLSIQLFLLLGSMLNSPNRDNTLSPAYMYTYRFICSCFMVVIDGVVIAFVIDSLKASHNFGKSQKTGVNMCFVLVWQIP